MLEVLTHIPKGAVVWGSIDSVVTLLSNVLPGFDVRLLGRDGWPSQEEKGNIMVRLSSTPPVLPVSYFYYNEIVLRSDQLELIGADGGGSLG